jgi:hypothetical protein
VDVSLVVDVRDTIQDINHDIEGLTNLGERSQRSDAGELWHLDGHQFVPFFINIVVQIRVAQFHIEVET